MSLKTPGFTSPVEGRLSSFLPLLLERLLAVEDDDDDDEEGK